MPFTHLHLHTQLHASRYGLHSLPPPRGAVRNFSMSHADAKWREFLVLQVNKKSCELKKEAYRDCIKTKGDKIGMGYMKRG